MLDIENEYNLLKEKSMYIFREVLKKNNFIFINFLIIFQLLCFNLRERLGNGWNGVEDIKFYLFFYGINWNNLEN